MKCKATIKTQSKDAQAISQALEVDNLSEEELTISSCLLVESQPSKKSQNQKIFTKIYSQKLNSLLYTLDDFVKCQKMAEKLIKEQ